MIRTLLATTALAALLTTGASAQQAATPADQAAPSVAQKSGNVGYFAASPEQILASSVIGKTVYTGADEEGEAVGDVNDVVINATGGAEALVIGVGGFLGIGEKDVAVNFDRVSLSDRDGQRIIVISATKEELQAAPQFDRAPIMDGVAATVPEDTSSEDTVAAPGATSTEMSATAPATAEPQTAETTIPTTGTTPEMTDPEVPADQAATTQATQSEELQPVDPALLSAEKLIGTSVKVADDTEIGKIGDVILSKDGKLEAYVIDVGGFLGMGAKPVAMNAQSVQVMADAGGAMTIYSPFTKEQLEQQPAYDKDSYAAGSTGVMLSAPSN
ncbi:PRC-barrel domain-containing protein [Pararhizobium antarcticum]|nr:PRC-barrel domain-containing protein [Pararhizobium antarcticum]